MMSDELLFFGRINPKSFTRERKMPFLAMITFIINFAKRSLQLELNSFTALCDRQDTVTKQAFSKARQNLSPKVFQLLNEKLIIDFYSDNIINLFKGFRIFGIDGTTIRLPQSEELYKEYGSNVANNSVPLAKTSVLYDVLNHVAIHATLQRHYSSERNMAIENILDLCKLDDQIKNNHIGDIVIFDRGYPWIFLMFFMLNKNKHFIMRCSRTVLSEINIAAQSDLRDAIILISAFKKGRPRCSEFAQYLPQLTEDAFIKIRVLQFDLPSGEKEIIISSLLDQNQFFYNDFFALYGLRWNNEEAYKFYKNIAEIENFSGKSKITVEQDFYATIFGCNIASILMQEAQLEVEQTNNIAGKYKYSYKINRNILIGSLKNEIIA